MAANTIVMTERDIQTACAEWIGRHYGISVSDPKWCPTPVLGGDGRWRFGFKYEFDGRTRPAVSSHVYRSRDARGEGT